MISIVLARPIIPRAIRSVGAAPAVIDDSRLRSFFSRESCTCAREVRSTSPSRTRRSLSLRHEINLSPANRSASHRHDRSLLVKHWTNCLARFRWHDGDTTRTMHSTLKFLIGEFLLKKFSSPGIIRALMVSVRCDIGFCEFSRINCNFLTLANIRVLLHCRDKIVIF